MDTSILSWQKIKCIFSQIFQPAKSQNANFLQTFLSLQKPILTFLNLELGGLRGPWLAAHSVWLVYSFGYI